MINKSMNYNVIFFPEELIHCLMYKPVCELCDELKKKCQHNLPLCLCFLVLYK